MLASNLCYFSTILSSSYSRLAIITETINVLIVLWSERENLPVSILLSLSVLTFDAVLSFVTQFFTVFSLELSHQIIYLKLKEASEITSKGYLEKNISGYSDFFFPNAPEHIIFTNISVKTIFLKVIVFSLGNEKERHYSSPSKA